jgi:hypothetical protein
MKKLIIGISGFATSGKDTCASLVCSYLDHAGFKSKTFSFANALKQDIDDFCTQKIGISAFTTEPLLKSKIRSILISYGQIQRDLSNGTYWIHKVSPKIDDFFNLGGNVAIVPDLRFKEFEYDELDYIRSFDNSIIVNVERSDNNNQIKAAHESENKYYKILQNESDIKIKWESSNDVAYLNSQISDLIKLINLKLNLEIK